MIYNDTLDLIGNTPVLEVKCFDIGKCRLFLKLESMNPGGSIKDRIGLSMIEAAEREGKIKPGDTLIEATAGNTGLGLALSAIKKGYRLILVIPDKMSQEKIMNLRALGVEILLTRSDVEKGHPEYYQDYAQRLSENIPNSYYINQFNNPANPYAHETTTGPEIWEQTNHEIDAISVGVGSAGTLAGLTAFFLKTKPDIELILADPEGSILADYVNTGTSKNPGSWFVEGIGEDFIPPQADFSLVKKGYSISDAESFLMVRTLLLKEGILAGSSSGTLIAAAVRYAKDQTKPKNILTFVCDSGNKYLSKMYNDFWLRDNGFIQREKTDDVRELIARKYNDRVVITVKKSDTVDAAYSRMKLNDVSQLPVVEDDNVVGIIDETDIFKGVIAKGPKVFLASVNDLMTSDIVYVEPFSSIESVVPILLEDYTVIVKDQTKFYGLITKMDYLQHVRRQIIK